MNLADQFAVLWEANTPLPDVFAFLESHTDAPPRECADILLIDQHHRWQRGAGLPVETYFQRFPAIARDPELRLDLVFSELRNHAKERGGIPDLAEFVARFPDLGDDLIRQFEVAEWLDTRQGVSLQGAARKSMVDRDDVLLHLAVRMDFLSKGTLESLRQDLGTHEPKTLVRAVVDRGFLTDKQNSSLIEFTNNLLNDHHDGDTHDSAPMTDRPGSVVDKRLERKTTPGSPASSGFQPARPASAAPDLEILERLGEGGMGVVYRARQGTLNRVVALKMIHAEARTDPRQLARFRTEIQAVARLSHPNFVQIYEIGERDGLPYFVMEHVNGGSLERKLGSGPLPVRQAAQLVETLARAMSIAHDHGIVHRDLKPANILLTLDGQPKITDFGLAKISNGEDTGLSRSGAIIGTPAYMAPEQARGSSVSASSDLYSLGATLYEMLTGRPPFRAATIYGTLLQVMNQEPVPPGRLRTKLPRDLETICLKCLEKEPQRRYPNTLALAEDLHAFLSGEPIRARGAKSWELALRWFRRNPARGSLTGVAALTTLLLLRGIWSSNTLVVSSVAVLCLIAGGSWYQARLLSVLREMTRQQIVTERYAERLQMLGEMSRQLMTVTDLDPLLYLLGETASRLANAELATLYLIDRDLGEVWSKVKLGNDIEEIRVPMGTGIAGTVAETGQVINLSDPYTDPRFNPEIDRQTGFTTRNLLTLPMIARSGEVIGVFQVLNKRLGIFETEDEEVLSALAATGAVVIERARAPRGNDRTA